MDGFCFLFHKEGNGIKENIDFSIFVGILDNQNELTLKATFFKYAKMQA